MTDTEKEVLCARIDKLCVDNDRLRNIQSRLVALIESLLHCMSDMETGIGCDGCMSNTNGACTINCLLDEYKQRMCEVGMDKWNH